MVERLLPWESNPYEPTDWWEMFQYSASLFFTLGFLTEQLFQESLSKPTFGGVQFDSRLLKAPLDSETRDKAFRTYRMISGSCRDVGMDISAETAAELAEKIDRQPTYDYDRLISDNGALRKLLQKEMKGKLFLYMTPERSRFWPQTDSFIVGNKVETAFPSARFDVTEAAACLALARSTGCVFHLMRVLESALAVLGAKFNVALERTNWQNAIDQIESKVNRMNQDAAWRSLSDCKEQQEFYSQAISHLRTAKDAWRNYTAHSRGKFTEQEAQAIFESVKSFMQKLAERLSE